MMRWSAFARVLPVAAALLIAGAPASQALPPKPGAGAVAPPDWAAAAVGTYVGRISNGATYSTVTTTFTLDQTSGRVSGTYRIQEATRQVDGKLQLARVTGENGAVFQWSDLYGAGTLTVLFAVNAGHFDGKWSATNVAPAKNQTWNGRLISKP